MYTPSREVIGGEIINDGAGKQKKSIRGIKRRKIKNDSLFDVVPLCDTQRLQLWKDKWPEAGLLYERIIWGGSRREKMWGISFFGKVWLKMCTYTLLTFVSIRQWWWKVLWLNSGRWWWVFSRGRWTRGPLSASPGPLRLSGNASCCCFSWLTSNRRRRSRRKRAEH